MNVTLSGNFGRTGTFNTTVDIKLKQWTESQVLDIWETNILLLLPFLVASQICGGWLGMPTGRVSQTDGRCKEKEGP